MKIDLGLPRVPVEADRGHVNIVRMPYVRGNSGRKRAPVVRPNVELSGR